jgi:hypothetical protein
MSTSDELRELKTALQIDRDDLDRCLVEQPGLFYQVAKAVAIALSERHGLEFQLKKAEAALNRQLRETAIKNSEKLTETALSKRVVLMPTIQKLRRQLLQAKLQADQTLALKEAFQQRSYTLRLASRLVACRRSYGNVSARLSERTNLLSRDRSGGAV